MGKVDAPWKFVELDKKTSDYIYAEVRKVSSQILKNLGCATEPHEPVTRTRPWESGLPQGIAYHYTGGPNGIKSTKWFNHPGWGNTSSSCHVMIFDRIVDNIVGELWTTIDPEIRKLFPIPTLILADWKWGVWCTNWTNGYCLGVENRNIGRNMKYATKQNGLYYINDKCCVDRGVTVWEPYTREQIVCNINIGRLLRGWTEKPLDPDWFIAHSMVYSIKSDPGPDFLLHNIRDATFNSDPIQDLTWLENYEMAPDKNEDYDQFYEINNEFRDDPTATHVDFTEKDEFSPPPIDLEAPPTQREWVINTLNKMGFNCGPEEPSDSTLKKFVKQFQYSTYAYKQINKPQYVLFVDGVAGPQTQKGMERRLKELGIEK